MTRPTPQELKRELCDLTVVEPTTFGFEIALAQVYGNGETVIVTVQHEDGSRFYVHDGGNGAMALEAGGHPMSAKLEDDLRRGVSAYGCNIAQARVSKQCSVDDVAATAAIVGCASRFVADYHLQSEVRPMFDFRQQVIETLAETIGSNRIRENDEVTAKSGSRYQVSATILDERQTKPVAYVEAVSNHQSVTRKFRALYDIMHTPMIAETQRVAIIDDTRRNITSADLALLRDVSKTVGFRERNNLSRIAELIH
ncbi:hypothetical protein [Parafrankia sp. BMG5.11]|uniref:hypothetical protein n=1 Tax=Parafrankia sp. BMG5.11 TaxID=222540 RepID=UPI0010392413|nr:hypothetical protein [Parafrankia sp. BMG5.11]TCJ38382.1 hypothetical protein E0504_15640 [Parafrankia sp. BMG5.11]